MTRHTCMGWREGRRESWVAVEQQELAGSVEVMVERTVGRKGDDQKHQKERREESRHAHVKKHAIEVLVLLSCSVYAKQHV